jgi:hypothetical protein
LGFPASGWPPPSKKFQYGISPARKTFAEMVLIGKCVLKLSL